MEPVVGFEPTTTNLQDWRSTPELNRHGPNYTILGLVDLIGYDPTAFCLQNRCSTD